jgi:hypothetical protein
VRGTEGPRGGEAALFAAAAVVGGGEAGVGVEAVPAAYIFFLALSSASRFCCNSLSIRKISICCSISAILFCERENSSVTSLDFRLSSLMAVAALAASQRALVAAETILEDSSSLV